MVFNGMETTTKPAGRNSLRERLTYEPKELKFGTSGRRGEVRDLTQLEIYINALAELEYLQSLTPEEGGIVQGQEFYFACDLRPSSTAYVPEQQGRGEIAQAIVCAIEQAGLLPVNLGRIPTPALMYYATSEGRGSVMVTGSHIPLDRNGYKLNTSRGELLKKDEGPIGERVLRVRETLYDQPFARSLFDEVGRLKAGHRELPLETDAARSDYAARYEDFFEGQSLAGMRLAVYQHSAVGRDLLADLLRHFGAEVIACGRSETFIPIDTENIGAAQLAAIQLLADGAREKHGAIDAVVSTDGDSDRPLIVGIDPVSGHARFFGGDLVGMIAAEYLGADAVVVPISCNDAIDRGPLKDMLEPKTRIGSPYVVAGMEKARNRGRRRICGWEANGGFLTGSDMERNGRILKALPTRDALLPILCVLFAAREKGVACNDLFASLPRRFSRAALLEQFPKAAASRIVSRYSPSGAGIREVAFDHGQVSWSDENGTQHEASEPEKRAMEAIRSQLEGCFPPEGGFGAIARLNYVDGVRIVFRNGEVAHVRPSGNADELRIYAVADSQARADAIAEMGVREPDGILRKMEKASYS